MEVPKFPSAVGRYQHGLTPGELGDSILVGHVDRPGGIAVFWRLRELTPGQIIEVSRADGSTVRFAVESVKQFEQNNFPTTEVYGNLDQTGLYLMPVGAL